MDRTRGTAFARGRPERGFVIGTGLLIIAAAALPALAADDGAEAYRARWARDVLRAGVDPALIPYPLEYTPEMQRIARSVSGTHGPSDQLRFLQDYLFDEKRFPFDYESRETYTAIEAFETRVGNCVSFTNLFIAMGRSLGHRVRAALPTFRGDTEREGGLIVVNTHIVAVYERDTGYEVFDFSRYRERQRVGFRIIDDVRVTAIYLNNLGAEAIFQNQPGAARYLLGAAVKLAPDYAGAYGNLGVASRMEGDIDGALEAYRRALEIDPEEATILNNLAALYRSLGRDQEAEAAIQAANLRGATPYLLIIRGDFELGRGRHAAALKLFRRAARLGPDLPEPHLAIARAERARGRPQAEERALRRALEIDPENTEAVRMLRAARTGPDPG